MELTSVEFPVEVSNSVLLFTMYSNWCWWHFVLYVYHLCSFGAVHSFELNVLHLISFKPPYNVLSGHLVCGEVLFHAA